MIKSLENIITLLLLMLLPLSLRATSDTTMVGDDDEPKHQLSLLHISDVHGSDNGLRAMVNKIMPTSNDVVAINGELPSHQ